MNAILNRIFSTERYANRLVKDQARLVYSFTTLMMALFLGYSFFVRQGTSGVTLIQEISDPRIFVSVVSMVGLGIVTIVLTRNGRVDIAGAGPVLMWFLSGILISFRGGFAISSTGATLLVMLILCGLFLRVRGLLIGTVVALVTLLVSGLTYQLPTTLTNQQTYATNQITLAIELIGMAILIYLFLRSTRLDQVDSAARAYEERYKLANVTTQIAQRIQRRANLNELLESAIDEIRTSYSDIYHVQIFLTDDTTREAVLAASTGEVGKLLLQRQHRLEVGSRSVIGQVTAIGDPIIARSGSPDGVHRRNEFLPDTVVEAAFPLKIGNTVIGALDLQSRYSTAFAENDIPVFQSLADNIAVAIDNARLFEQTEQRLQENQRLLEQTRGAAQEVERLNRELTHQAWGRYLENRTEQLSIDIDFISSIVRKNNDWTPTLTEAVEFNHVVQKQIRDGVTISMPLRVRGLVIGAMEFELEGEVLTPEDVDLVQAVGERFGLAVESTRLYEESRRVAQRETMLNEIGGRLQRTNSIDAVLSEAALGLQTSLGANRVAIRLGPPPKAAENGGEQ